MPLTPDERVRIRGLFDDTFPEHRRRFVFPDRLGEWVRHRPDLTTTGERSREAASVLAFLYAPPGLPPTVLDELEQVMGWDDGNPARGFEQGVVSALCDVGHGRPWEKATTGLQQWLRLLIGNVGVDAPTRTPMEDLFRWLNPPACSSFFAELHWTDDRWEADLIDSTANLISTWLICDRCECNQIREAHQGRMLQDLDEAMQEAVLARQSPPCDRNVHRLRSWRAMRDRHGNPIPLRSFLLGLLGCFAGRLTLEEFRFSMLFAALCDNGLPVRVVNVPSCTEHGAGRSAEINPDTDTCPECERGGGVGSLRHQHNYHQLAILLGSRIEHRARRCETCDQMLFLENGQSRRGCGPGGHSLRPRPTSFWCPVQPPSSGQRRRPRHRPRNS